MKIGIVSSILGHGSHLPEVGTALTLLASEMTNVEKINVITWVKDSSEDISFPNKVIVTPLYSDKKPLTVFDIIKECLNGDADRLIFNLMPTALGNSSIANFTNLLAPFVLKQLFHKEVTVIYHNSIFTNDFVKLGYSGLFNKLRATVVRLVETVLFTTVDVLMFNRIYVEKIGKKITNSKVEYIDLKFFQVLGTLFLNEKMHDGILHVKPNPKPHLLLFGKWGPQKDPLALLKKLKKLRSSGKEFFLTVAGGVNPHFPRYKDYVNRIFTEYSDVIDKRLEYVPERELMGLFLETDLLLINYNAPGGFSSVLSFGIFFDTFIIASNFQELQDQIGKNNKIVLCQPHEFETEIAKYIDLTHKSIYERKIEIKFNMKKMNETFSQVMSK